MGAARKVDAFEAWSKQRGLVARDVDRRRVAGELLELAGDGALDADHIEELAKKYRQGLMGARAILGAKRVGQELLEWQEEQAKEADRPRSIRPDPRLEDGEEPPRAESIRPTSLSSAPAAGRSTRPQPRSVAPSEAPPAASATISEVPSAAKAEVPSDDLPAPSTSLSQPAERPRSDPPLSVSLKAPAAPKLDAALLGEDSFAVDDAPVAPKKKPRFELPHADLPEVERSEEGVSEERKKRARLEQSAIDASAGNFNSVPPPLKSTRPPGLDRIPSNRPPPILAAAADTTSSGFVLSPRMIGMGLGALLMVVLAIVFFARPAFLFANSARPVMGDFTSKHLKLRWVFPDQWLHAEDLDDSESTRDGYKRKVSVFYRGTSANNFQAQFTLVTFEGKPVSPNDAQQLGANEVIGTAMRRRCDPGSINNVPATVCTSLAARPGQAYAVVEEYFALEQRGIFLRFQFAVDSPIPQDPQSMSVQSDLNERQMQQRLDEVDKLVRSIQPLR